jgi:hypothetical protein
MMDCTCRLDKRAKKYKQNFDGDNIKMGNRKICCEDVNCIEQVQESSSDGLWAKSTVELLGSIKGQECSD